MKKYLLFAIVVFSLFIVNPKAAVLPKNSYNVKVGNSELPYTTGVGAGGYIRPNILFYNLSEVDVLTAKFNFLILDVCSGNLFTNDNVTIENAGTNAYFNSDSLLIYNTSMSCDIGGGYKGVLYKVQMQVGKYVDSQGDGLYSGSYLKVINKYGYYTTTIFKSSVVSDEDVLTGLLQNNITNDLQRDILNQQKEFIKKQDQTNSKLDDLKGKQDQTNSKLDNIKDMDAPDSAKTKPDDSDYKNYEKAESDLTDKISDIPTDTLEIGIDANSSNFIFDTMNKLINAHPAVFSMFIAILSIGIIKLGLGR